MAYLALAGAIIEFVKGVPMLFGIVIRHIVRIVILELPFLLWLATALLANWAVGHYLFTHR